MLKFDELFHDGEAKAASTVFSRDACIRLAEAFKDRIKLVRWDTDPSIDDLDLYHTTILFLVFRRAQHLDLAAVCKLYGIADQVDEDLVQSHRVPEQVTSDRLMDFVFQL